MGYLSPIVASALLRRAPAALGGAWPSFSRHTGIVANVAVRKRPGKMCSIAWAKLTLVTGPAHKAALDAQHELFFWVGWRAAHERDWPIKPHCLTAYDNPEKMR